MTIDDNTPDTNALLRTTMKTLLEQGGATVENRDDFINGLVNRFNKTPQVGGSVGINRQSVADWLGRQPDVLETGWQSSRIPLVETSLPSSSTMPEVEKKTAKEKVWKVMARKPLTLFKKLRNTSKQKAVAITNNDPLTLSTKLPPISLPPNISTTDENKIVTDPSSLMVEKESELLQATTSSSDLDISVSTPTVTTTESTTLVVRKPLPDLTSLDQSKVMTVVFGRERPAIKKVLSTLPDASSNISLKNPEIKNIEEEKINPMTADRLAILAGLNSGTFTAKDIVSLYDQLMEKSRGTVGVQWNMMDFVEVLPQMKFVQTDSQPKIPSTSDENKSLIQYPVSKVEGGAVGADEGNKLSAIALAKEMIQDLTKELSYRVFEEPNLDKKTKLIKNFFSRMNQLGEPQLMYGKDGKLPRGDHPETKENAQELKIAFLLELTAGLSGDQLSQAFYLLPEDTTNSFVSKLDSLERAIRPRLIKLHEEGSPDSLKTLARVEEIYSRSQPYRIVIGWFEHLNLFNDIQNDPVKANRPIKAKLAETLGSLFNTYENFASDESYGPNKEPNISKILNPDSKPETKLDFSAQKLGGKLKDWRVLERLHENEWGTKGSTRYHVPKIHTLILSGHDLTEKDFPNLTSLPDLRVVVFDKNKIQKKDLDKVLRKLPAGCKVHLQDNPIEETLKQQQSPEMTKSNQLAIRNNKPYFTFQPYEQVSKVNQSPLQKSPQPSTSQPPQNRAKPSKK